MNTERFAGYTDLLAAFIDGRVGEGEFARRFLERYLGEDRDTRWTAGEFAILERLFGDVEEFEPDEELRRELVSSVTPGELRAGATRALAELRSAGDAAPEGDELDLG